MKPAPHAPPDMSRNRSPRELSEPAMEPATAAAVDSAIAQWRDVPGALLPLLHAVQDALGYVPASAVPSIARALGLSRAEVHGVITYYHHFRTEAPGRNVVQICRAESCLACGSDALVALAEQTLGCSMHQTSPGGSVTLEPVYCLGLCAASPAVQVNGQLHARVSAPALGQMLSQLEKA